MELQTAGMSRQQLEVFRLAGRSLPEHEER